VRTAAVQFRVNPDGTLKSFVVLNAADQGDEIAFIKAVVERAAHIQPFPAGSQPLGHAPWRCASASCRRVAAGSGFEGGRWTRVLSQRS
jgi:hypothetical protein